MVPVGGLPDPGPTGPPAPSPVGRRQPHGRGRPRRGGRLPRRPGERERRLARDPRRLRAAAGPTGRLAAGLAGARRRRRSRGVSSTPRMPRTGPVCCSARWPPSRWSPSHCSRAAGPAPRTAEPAAAAARSAGQRFPRRERLSPSGASERAPRRRGRWVGRRLPLAVVTVAVVLSTGWILPAVALTAAGLIVVLDRRRPLAARWIPASLVLAGGGVAVVLGTIGPAGTAAARRRLGRSAGLPGRAGGSRGAGPARRAPPRGADAAEQRTLHDPVADVRDGDGGRDGQREQDGEAALEDGEPEGADQRGHQGQVPEEDAVGHLAQPARPPARRRPRISPRSRSPNTAGSSRNAAAIPYDQCLRYHSQVSKKLSVRGPATGRVAIQKTRPASARRVAETVRDHVQPSEAAAPGCEVRVVDGGAGRDREAHAYREPVEMGGQPEQPAVGDGQPAALHHPDVAELDRDQPAEQDRLAAQLSGRATAPAQRRGEEISGSSA